jgi:hypothetical protein
MPPPAPARPATPAPAAQPLHPFRWDVTRRERLGRLLSGAPADSYAEFADDLRACCGRVVSAAAHLAAPAGEPDLFFVGRSPESLFDYLRGLCAGTPWSDRLRPLHFSMRGEDVDARNVRNRHPAGLASLRAYLAALALDPRSLAARGRPAVFVDLVCNGRTFANLVGLLRRWCRDVGVGWHAARRAVRLVGIVDRGSEPWRGYRWDRHGPGIDRLPRGAVRAVPVRWRLWDYLGNRQPKLAQSYPPAAWGDERVGRPFRSPDHAPALRLAVRLYETAGGVDERERFIALLDELGGLRLASLRGLASGLRRHQSRGLSPPVRRCQICCPLAVPTGKMRPRPVAAARAPPPGGGHVVRRASRGDAEWKVHV